MAFDTREYEWADITLFFGGEEITGFRGLKHKEKIEREVIYAKGRMPRSIQSGNQGFEGSITALQSAYERLVELGGGTILSLAGDILIGYGNPSNGDAIMHKRVLGARFGEAEVAWKQGDKFTEIELPWMALNIINKAQK